MHFILIFCFHSISTSTFPFYNCIYNTASNDALILYLVVIPYIPTYICITFLNNYSYLLCINILYIIYFLLNIYANTYNTYMH